MVSKCANYGCSAVFLYLHAGEVFPVEVESPKSDNAGFGRDAEMKKPARHIEFFWLCQECASKMTLVFSKTGGVATKPIARAKAVAL
jgi:hypothetical protein